MDDDRGKKRDTRINVKKAEAFFTSQAPESLPLNHEKPLPISLPSDGIQSLDNLENLAIKNDKKRKRIILTGPLRPLRLPPITEAGGLSLIVQKRSPWELYRRFFQCELAGTVHICENRREASDLVAIRMYKSQDGESMLKKYRHIRHANILTAIECFKHQETHYFVVDDLPISLEHVVASDAFPTESQLSCILRQILAGMCCLLECGYQIPSLKCSSVLMGLDGIIKIAISELTLPHEPGKSQRPSVECIGYLAMELMQKYVKENIGIDDTRRWPIDSKAAGFLVSTTSESTLADLNQHPLIKMASPPQSLAPLARLAIISACTFYSFKE